MTTVKAEDAEVEDRRDGMVKKRKAMILRAARGCLLGHQNKSGKGVTNTTKLGKEKSFHDLIWTLR